MFREKKDRKKIIQRLKEILIKEKSILFAYLHGSFLSDEEFNDIDLALYLDEKAANEIEPVDFEISLSLRIGESLKMPVDVKLLNYAPLGFRYQVTKGYLLVSHLDVKREEFLCKTWSEYFDFQPIPKIYLKEVLSAQI
jgi:predicted nucleotidyltransferase